MRPIVKAVKAAIQRGKIDGQWRGFTYLKPCKLAATYGIWTAIAEDIDYLYMKHLTCQTLIKKAANMAALRKLDH